MKTRQTSDTGMPGPSTIGETPTTDGEAIRGVPETTNSEVHALREMMVMFIQQQQATNELLLEATRQSNSQPPAAVVTTSPGTRAPTVPEHPAPLTPGGGITEGESSIPFSDGAIHEGGPPVMANVVGQEEWKKVALALAGRQNSVSGRERPTFRPDRHHPVDFVQRLDSYMHSFVGSPAEKLEVAKDCLKKDATYWQKLCQGNWSSYEDFRHAFLAYYWSMERQVSERM